jgi:hypothetical protein
MSSMEPPLYAEVEEKLDRAWENGKWFVAVNVSMDSGRFLSERGRAHWEELKRAYPFEEEFGYSHFVDQADRNMLRVVFEEIMLGHGPYHGERCQFGVEEIDREILYIPDAWTLDGYDGPEKLVIDDSVVRQHKSRVGPVAAGQSKHVKKQVAQAGEVIVNDYRGQGELTIGEQTAEPGGLIINIPRDFPMLGCVVALQAPPNLTEYSLDAITKKMEGNLVMNLDAQGV